MNIFRNAIALFLFMTISLLSGCASPPLKIAINLDSEFQTASNNEVTLLPVIDSRVDKEIEVNFDEQLRDPVKALLENKGYVVSFSNDISDFAQITEDDLKSEYPEFIKLLDSSSASRVMVVMLVDVSTELTFGSTGNAEVSGFMYGNDSKKMIWHDKGIGKAGQGGLIGMFMKGSMGGAAINRAVANLLASIPKHPNDSSKKLEY